MTDVAKLAGVSHQTVSRVINGSPQVRPATRERVLAAMAELDYRPNPAARGRAPPPPPPRRAGRPPRAVPDARRGELRHHPVRAGLDALRDRARGPRRGL